MYKKVILAVCIVFCVFCSACVSTGTGKPTDRTVLEYQRQAAESEARISLLENRIADAIRLAEECTDRVERGESEIDAVLTELDSYHRTVLAIIQLLRETGTGTTK